MSKLPKFLFLTSAIALSGCAGFPSGSQAPSELSVNDGRMRGIMALCGMGISENGRGIRTRLEKEILSNAGMSSAEKMTGYTTYANCITKLSSEEGIYQTYSN